MSWPITWPAFCNASCCEVEIRRSPAACTEYLATRRPGVLGSGSTR